MINFKTYSKSYKKKARIENPGENRAIFLNVHEAVIDRENVGKGTEPEKRHPPQKAAGHAGVQHLLRPAEMP